MISMRDDHELRVDDDGSGFVAVDLTEYDLDAIPHAMQAYESSDTATAPIPARESEEFATALELANEALAEVTEPERVGELMEVVDEGEGVYSLKFASRSPGHLDWFWTVSLVRLEDAEEPSVLEVELLPGDDALLAPEWVPWAERLAEYRATHDRHGNPLPDAEEGGADGEDAETTAPRAERARTSTRTRTRRRRRRDRESGDGAEGAGADEQASAAGATASEAAAPSAGDPGEGDRPASDGDARDD